MPPMPAKNNNTAEERGFLFMIAMRQHSIQTKLVLFFFILTIALFLSVGFLFLGNTQTVIISAKEKELMTLSEETSNKIERFLFERYGDIEVMAQSPVLRDMEASNKLKFDYLESVRTAYKTYDSIFVVDAAGKIVISSGTMDKNQEYIEVLQKVKKGLLTESDFILFQDNQRYGVYFAAPIISNKGEITGAVVERMNLDAIENIVRNVRPGKAGYAYLMDSNNKTIFFPGYNNNDGIVDINQQKENITYFKRGEQQHVAAFYEVKGYKSGENQWYLVVEEPTSEAFEVMKQLTNYIIVVVLSSICILFILSIIMSHAITGPIKRLVKETHNAAESSLGQNIVINSNDELGSLARSFNTMQANLKSMMQQVLEKSGEAASLEEIRQYADKIFENVPSAVLTIDNTGKITTFNAVAAKLTGIQQGDIVGESIKKQFPDSINPIIKLLQVSLEKGVIYIKHITDIINISGSVIPILIDTSIQKDSLGNTIGAIGVFRSVKEIQQFEESITRAKNLASLGELSAGMAHEIRNPLTSIKGYAQYIKSELADNQELIPDVSTIISEVDRLNGIIDRFLNFARPNHPELQPKDINILLRGALEFYNSKIPSNICLLTYFENLPTVSIDSDQIEQVVLNMLLNAVQAMPDGGELSIRTRYLKQFGLAEIIIADTGSGISAENYDKIFEPFFTTKNKGTGLGLAICSRIVENHKGFIEVNTTPGEKTEFIIRLPVNEGGLI
ncbi:MAG TPA: ATP-binding protein [Patescibacteria group bacterium]|nr:ATP-binding protein [Patescibacteria group bacterium]